MKHKTAEQSPALLWCVALIPKIKRDKEQEEKLLRMVLKGPGSSEIGAMWWVSTVMCGIADHRELKHVEWRQRLVVFTDRKEAARWARKAENESWKARVREVRIISS